MLHREFDPEHNLVILTPEGELCADDFKRLTDWVDQQTAAHGPISGLMILAEHFPGWDSFGALFQHLKFIRQQRDQVKKVAAVTDSGFLAIMPHIIDHFIQADVRHFEYGDRSQAEAWLYE